MKPQHSDNKPLSSSVGEEVVLAEINPVLIAGDVEMGVAPLEGGVVLGMGGREGGLVKIEPRERANLVKIDSRERGVVLGMAQVVEGQVVMNLNTLEEGGIIIARQEDMALVDSQQQHEEGGLGNELHF